MRENTVFPSQPCTSLYFQTQSLHHWRLFSWGQREWSGGARPVLSVWSLHMEPVSHTQPGTHQKWTTDTAFNLHFLVKDPSPNLIFLFSMQLERVIHCIHNIHVFCATLVSKDHRSISNFQLVLHVCVNCQIIFHTRSAMWIVQLHYDWLFVHNYQTTRIFMTYTFFALSLMYYG